MTARRLSRAVTGVSAANFYWWTMSVSGVSKTNGPELLEWPDFHEITRGGGFQK